MCSQASLKKWLNITPNKWRSISLNITPMLPARNAARTYEYRDSGPSPNSTPRRTHTRKRQSSPRKTSWHESMPAYLTRLATTSSVVLTLLSIAVSLASYAKDQTQDSAMPRTTVDSGVLEGTRWHHGVRQIAFLGIPFADPPVGELRWKPPRLPVKWQGVRAAKQFSPSCPQFPSGWWPEMAGRKQFDTSEDCLYLNVWTATLSPLQGAPVIVWIHGGGNVEGSSQIPPLASALVSKGVVFVSIEYRLGVFGFFAHPALTAESANHSSGNYGLLDQIAALD